MAVSTAHRVAESLIKLSQEKQQPVTNLKLQKLLYYAQAWYLVFNGKPLFDDPIEAWVHGPVVPEIFRRYKQYQWDPITEVPSTSIHQRDHLEQVWGAYGKFNATELERLTHSEDPWRHTRVGLPIDVSSSRIIPTGMMKRYYSSLLNG